MQVVSGDQQTGAAGTQLSQPLVVEVTKPNGEAQKDQILNFKVTAGGGSVFAGTAITDNRGVAQELWTVGTRAGEPQRIEVRAVDPQTGAPQVFGVFTATVIPGPPDRMIAFGPQQQTVAFEFPVAFPPTVRLWDRYGNLASGASVAFEGQGTLSAATVTADARGIASVSWIPVQDDALESTITATVAGENVVGNPATFRAIPARCGCWRSEPPMSTARSRLGAAAVDGKLYAIGGEGPNSALVEEFDPLTARWTTKAAMPTARYGLGAAAIDRLIYAVGGLHLDPPSGSGSGPVGTLEVYDPATNTWQTKAPMSTPREYVGAVAIDGKLYVVGGERSGFPDAESTKLEVYDPSTDTWTRKADLPLPRRFFGAAALDGILYVVGGWDENYEDTGTLQAYDPATDTWTQRAPMPTARTDLAAVGAFGRLYAMGGQDHDAPSPSAALLATVEAYDPVTNSWTTKNPMPRGYSDRAASLVNGRFYAVGGLGFSSAAQVDSYLP